MANKWLKLACNKAEVNLDIVLHAGQSFRWHKTQPGEWTGVLCERVYTLSQSETDLLYKVFHKGFGISQAKCSNKTKQKAGKGIANLCQSSEALTKEDSSQQPSKKSRKTDITGELNNINCSKNEKSFVSDSAIVRDKEDAEILKSYFNLNVSLSTLYKHWASKDSNFKHVAESFKGIRQLRQDPVENLFSFICSSNNNISRISGMVENMCIEYGEKIAVVDGKTYYAFPTIESLAGSGVEDTLRSLGFGYRAKYISQTAQYIQSQHSTQWLHELRNSSYEQARAELLKLCGVGPKVADCVCLMSLDKHGAVPIDTHVFQFAQRDYSKHPAIAKHKGAKTVTDRVYADIGDFFRSLWGDYAGWAQSVLFSAELPQIKVSQEKTTVQLKAKRKSTGKNGKSSQKKKKI